VGVILALDVGTTTLKAGVVDAQGKLLALVRRETPALRPEPDAAEHDPHALLEAFYDCAREAVAQAGQPVDRLVFSTYQLGLMCLDADGRPLTGLTTLLDNRARRTFAAFREAFAGPALYAATGCPPFFLYPLPRLFYFREKRPDIWARTARLHSSKSWLMAALTGVSRSDSSTECATQLLQLRSRQWDPGLLRQIGLPLAALPEVVEPEGEALPLLPAAAERLGLPAGTPVLPGVYDGAAIGLGLGVVEPGVGVLNVGTSGMLRVLSREPVLDTPDQMRFQTVCYPGGLYFAGGGLNNAAVVMKWFRDQVGGTPFEQMDGLARQSPPGANGVRFLPYLTGERDWRDGHALSGVLFGLREQTAHPDLLRALMEGVSCCFAALQRAMADCGQSAREIRAAGGGLRGSPLWQEIMAETLGGPLFMSESDEAALLGNAALGFAHTGAFADLATAARALASPGQWVRPAPEACAEAARRLAFWNDLRATLRDLFHRHATP
jgi:gluconokinase